MNASVRSFADLKAAVPVAVSKGALRFYDRKNGFGFVALDNGVDAYLSRMTLEASGIDPDLFVEGALFVGSVGPSRRKAGTEVLSVTSVAAPVPKKPVPETVSGRAVLRKFDAEKGIGLFRVIGSGDRVVVTADAFEASGSEVDINYDYDIVWEKRPTGLVAVSMGAPDHSVKRYASNIAIYDQYDPDRICLMAGMKHDGSMPDNAISPIPDHIASLDGGFSFGFR